MSAYVYVVDGGASMGSVCMGHAADAIRRAMPARKIPGFEFCPARSCRKRVGETPPRRHTNVRR